MAIKDKEMKTRAIQKAIDAIREYVEDGGCYVAIIDEQGNIANGGDAMDAPQTCAVAASAITTLALATKARNPVKLAYEMCQFTFRIVMDCIAGHGTCVDLFDSRGERTESIRSGRRARRYGIKRKS